MLVNPVVTYQLVSERILARHGLACTKTLATKGLRQVVEGKRRLKNLVKLCHSVAEP
jgi:hypothetical protein